MHIPTIAMFMTYTFGNIVRRSDYNRMIRMPSVWPPSENQDEDEGAKEEEKEEEKEANKEKEEVKLAWKKTENKFFERERLFEVESIDSEEEEEGGVEDAEMREEEDGDEEEEKETRLEGRVRRQKERIEEMEENEEDEDDEELDHGIANASKHAMNSNSRKSNRNGNSDTIYYNSFRKLRS